MSDWRANRVWAAALSLGLFLAGMASGLALSRLVGPPDPHRHGPGALLERYRDEIGLTDAQTKAIAPVLERHEDEMNALLERFDPEAEAIHRRANELVRAQLEPDQLERFERMLARFEQRRAERRQKVEAAARKH